jgi:hypothetical protein
MRRSGSLFNMFSFSDEQEGEDRRLLLDPSTGHPVDPLP